MILSLCGLLSVDSTKTDLGPSHFWGAWETTVEFDGKSSRIVKIYTPKYFITSVYTPDKFISATGGTWNMKPDKLEETLEFNTMDSQLVGTTYTINFTEHEETLKTEFNGIKQTWSRIDDGESDLAGAWRITGRERNGEMSQMKMGPRKTFKILSGTRFQWAAYNVETKQFMGTGGGTYTLKDGKYTENIEVFSRDNSRVGASLEFDYEVKGKEWHHSGLSSKGNPIYEIWTNQDK